MTDRTTTGTEQAPVVGTPRGSARPGADGRRGAAAVSRSTLMSLRRVLHAYREGWVLDDRLTAVARMAAEDARLHGLPAERMLVQLKEAWAALEEVRRMAMLDAGALLGRLVTSFVHAYYAPVRRPATTAARSFTAGARRVA